MVLVRCAAAAMKTSGEAMISYPAEWCSPNQASSKPSASRCSMSCRSRSSASVGFWPTGWNGARKMPNVRSSGASRLVIAGWSSLSSRSHQNLAVVTRCAEGLECGRGGREVDRRGDEEVRPGYAGAEAVQGGGELGGVVPEGEAEFDLLGHGHEGLDGVGVHAHAHHHDAAVGWRVGDERLQHAGHADGLEDHRVLYFATHDGRRDPLRDRPRYAEVGP